MENKRVEVKQAMDSKITEMETAMQAVKAKMQELTDNEGIRALAEMEAKRAEAQGAIQVATDLGEARLLLQQVEELDKDIQLQAVLNRGIATKAKGELTELFQTFFKLYMEAKPLFHAVDKEYMETMSLKTYVEDTALIDDYVSELIEQFSLASQLLYRSGLADQGDKFFGSVHLGQSPVAPLDYRLRDAMKKVKNDLDLDKARLSRM